MTKGLTMEVLESATRGDAIAINRLVLIFEPYINTLAEKRLKDDEGTEYTGIDINLKDGLIRKLIEATLKFDISKN